MFLASEAAFSAAALADPRLLEDAAPRAGGYRHAGDHGRPACGPWGPLRVDAEGLRTKGPLGPWVRRGVAYARSLAPKPSQS
jgi:hypothetical protein